MCTNKSFFLFYVACTVDSLGNSDCPKGKSCKEGMCQGRF